MELLINTILDKVKKTLPHINQNINMREYAMAINQALVKIAYSEQQKIEIVFLVIAQILYETGFELYSRRFKHFKYFRESSSNDTVGPMQVSAFKYSKKKALSYSQAHEELLIISENIAAGIAFLVEIIDTYSELENNLDYILSDWMAGHFSAINAGVQHQINLLSGSHSPIALDGDMLHYIASKDVFNVRHLTLAALKDRPTRIDYDSVTGHAYVCEHIGDEQYRILVPFYSATECAIHKVVPFLSAEQIRIDLVKSKSNTFPSTKTYHAIMGSSALDCKRLISHI